MATKADKDLLEGRRQCLFCPVLEKSLSKLLSHSISSHPLQYILLRRLSQDDKAEKTDKTASDPSVNPAKETDSGSPNGSHSQSLKRRLPTRESPANAQLTAPPMSPDHSSPKRKQPRHSSIRNSSSSKRQGSHRLPPQDGPNLRSSPSPSGQSCYPSSSSNLGGGEYRSISHGKKGNQEGRRIIGLLPTQACSHNRTPCYKFPFCSGRLCPFAHPPCPEGPESEPCIASKDCPFYHPSYEKTCFYGCFGKLRPNQHSRTVIHCPHAKMGTCPGVCEKPAKDCLGLHGECRYEDGKCPAGIRKCHFEHARFSYFCFDCRKLCKS